MADPSYIRTIMPSDPATIVVREYSPTDRKWVTDANVRHYVTEEDFDANFATAVSSALSMLAAQYENETSRFLIVETSDSHEPVGCVFFSAEDVGIGRLRLFYLDQAYRGRGIGRRMIEEVIAHARARDFDTIRVSTFDRHVSACRLYRAFGFQEQIRDSTVAFGQRMRQIDFEKVLSDHSR